MPYQFVSDLYFTYICMNLLAFRPFLYEILIEQEKTNGGENQNEAPLVDLSEPKKEVEEPSRRKDFDVELASTENKAETNTSVDVTEKKVEAAIEPTEKAKDKSDAPLVTV